MGKIEKVVFLCMAMILCLGAALIANRLSVTEIDPSKWFAAREESGEEPLQIIEEEPDHEVVTENDLASQVSDGYIDPEDYDGGKDYPSNSSCFQEDAPSGSNRPDDGSGTYAPEPPKENKSDHTLRVIHYYND